MINFVDHKSFILSSGTNDLAETVITMLLNDTFVLYCDIFFIFK